MNRDWDRALDCAENYTLMTQTECEFIAIVVDMCEHGSELSDEQKEVSTKSTRE